MATSKKAATKKAATPRNQAPAQDKKEPTLAEMTQGTFRPVPLEEAPQFIQGFN